MTKHELLDQINGAGFSSDLKEKLMERANSMPDELTVEQARNFYDELTALHAEELDTAQSLREAAGAIDDFVDNLDRNDEYLTYSTAQAQRDTILNLQELTGQTD